LNYNSNVNAIESETRDRLPSKNAHGPNYCLWLAVCVNYSANFYCKIALINRFKLYLIKILTVTSKKQKKNKTFTHNMAACEFCLQDGGVSEGFTHKMAAWENCLQDGDNTAFLRVLPTRWRRGRFAYKMAAFLRV